MSVNIECERSSGWGVDPNPLRGHCDWIPGDRNIDSASTSRSRSIPPYIAVIRRLRIGLGSIHRSRESCNYLSCTVVTMTRCCCWLPQGPSDYCSAAYSWDDNGTCRSSRMDGRSVCGGVGRCFRIVSFEVDGGSEPKGVSSFLSGRCVIPSTTLPLNCFPLILQYRLLNGSRHQYYVCLVHFLH